MFEGKHITSIHYTGGAVLFTDPSDVSTITAWILRARKLQVDPCSYLQYMFTEEGL